MFKQVDSTPPSVLVASFVIPYLICCLVHITHTRTIRLGLLPLGLASTAYLVATLKTSNGLISMLIAHHALIFNLNSSVRWGHADEGPIYRNGGQTPLPLYKIPSYGLYLLSDTYRHTSLAQPDAKPPLPDQPKPSQEQHLSLKQHISGLLMSLLVIDIVSFPTNILIAPNDPNFGLSTPLGRLIWGVSYFSKGCAGEIMAWQLHALIGLLGGMTRPEDWSRILHKPWKADSVNDFWGRRWHNLMTETFIRYVPFYQSLPRPLQLLSVFFNSALYHALLYYPMHHSFPLLQQATFYLGSALACLAERLFRQITGKRVEGIWGKVWTWGILFVVSAPLVEYCHLYGWGEAGRVLARQNSEGSPVFLLYKAFGGRMVED